MNKPGITWLPEEASAINEFLSTPIGQKWLTILVMRKPQLDLSSTERAALSGSFAAGYEAFLNQIGWSRNVEKPDEDVSAKAIDMVKD